MKVLLVNPRPTITFWTFSESTEIIGKRAHLPCLALATIASLTPPEVEVRLVDEACEPIDFDEDCDVVGITGYITQATRMFEIAEEFRSRGRLVAIGGPYATLSASTVAPHADVLFVGEAEHTWPRFLADLARNDWRSRYDNDRVVDCTRSPAPQVDMLSSERYGAGMVQTSRGCPFSCEFCDVIIYVGRRQRHKTPEQVVGELEGLHRDGHRMVFLADDNLTANRAQAAAILTAIGAWNAGNEQRMSLITQMSIDIARPQTRDQELLALASSAGLDIAFFGIETPNLAALRETKKHQNTRVDLVDAVKQVHAAGILVMAGMIVGFDSDGVDCFEAQYEFAQLAGLPLISLGMLNAPEGTPLEARLQRDQRLAATAVDDVYFSTNIVPKNMTRDDLRTGTAWLMNRLYAPDAFVARLAQAAADLPAKRVGGPDLGGAESVLLWQRLLRAYRKLGPGYAGVPREAAALLGAKALGWLTFSLLFYHHVVRMLERHGLLDPALAAAERPPLDGGSLVEVARAGGR